MPDVVSLPIVLAQTICNQVKITIHKLPIATLLLLMTARVVGADIFTGTDTGVGSHVKAFDNISLAEKASFFPYGGGFGGGVRVAAGDVTGDGIVDIITGAGDVGAGHVKVFNGSNGAEVRSFFAYGPSYLGGVFVGGGDVNNDSIADIVTGIDSGVASHVKVFSGSTGAELHSFFAYGAGFTGGVRVAAGDIDSDGFFDIITGAGAAGAGHVKVFSGSSGAELRSFLAYGANYTGGVFVGGGDVNDDGFDDIITGTDSAAGGPHVKVFSGSTGAELASFFAYDVGFTGGVRVASGDVDGDGFADIITGAGAAGAGHVKVFSGNTGAEIRSFLAYGASYSGGVFVGGGDNFVIPEPASALMLVFAMSLIGVQRRRR
jgi:hypothetical protein